MRRTEQAQGLRLMKFEEVYGRSCCGVLGQAAAAEILGVSERTFRRWRDRFEADGAEGLYDRRLGRVSARRAPIDEVARVLELFDTRYWDFTAKHFHEKLVAEHGCGRSYNWVRLTLQAYGRRRAAPRRGAHRRKRPRRALPGMMVHQDGSRHGWLAGQPPLDLIVTMDDATSEIYSAFFVEEEGTMSSFRALSEVIGERGLFCSLYADRASHYWHTPDAGGKVDKDNPTQVGRALQRLGIELIAAYSPEARGRSERMFGTLQKRLPQELRLAGITGIDEAMVRVRAGIGYALTEAMDEGHCGLPEEELGPLAARLLEVPDDLIRAALGLELAEGTVVADTVADTPCVFLGGLYRAEREIAGRLSIIAAGELPWPDIDVEKALPWVERKTGLVLAHGQADAVRLALTSKPSRSTNRSRPRLARRLAPFLTDIFGSFHYAGPGETILSPTGVERPPLQSLHSSGQEVAATRQSISAVSST